MNEEGERTRKPLPLFYVMPYGTPLYWQDDVSGTLRAIVSAYYDRKNGPPQMEPESLEILRAYLHYVINAPCWKGRGIAKLRARIASASTVADIDRFIASCLKIGIDPL